MVTRPKSRTVETPATNQAANWFARQRTGPWSEADAAEFSAWLKAHPAHTAAWASYERLWGRLDTVRDDPKILAIREQARRRVAHRQVWRWTWRLGAGFAASILVAGGVWWHLWYPLTPATRKAQVSQVSGSGPILVRDASTEIGERSVLVLVDGSKVTLNTASAVHADYTGRERLVTLLHGEAFFDVAKDPSRPFVVSAGSRQVIAVGTAFDVRLQDDQVKVTLVEGKVRILRVTASKAVGTASTQPVSALMLEAGSALVAVDGSADHIERLDADRATSWRSGKLVFDGERLVDVIIEMNRYSRERLEIADPALEGRRVSGVFEPSGGASFAKALEAYGIARVSQETTTTIVLDSLR